MEENEKILFGDFELLPVNEKQALISKYLGSDSEVVLPTSFGEFEIVAVGESAFFENAFLEKVTVPSGFECIMTWAFCNCSNLKEVILSESIQRIFPYAFENCQKLVKIVLPSSLKKIGRGSFMGCSCIKKITIPKDVDYIEENPFVGCSSLEEIDVDSKNPNFVSCNNCVIEPKTGTIRIGCKNSIIPNNIVCIGVKAFGEHNEISEILIPLNVKKLEYQSFFQCDLERIFAFEENIDAIQEYFKFESKKPIIYLYAKAETDFLKPGHWWKYHFEKGKIIDKVIKDVR